MDLELRQKLAVLLSERMSNLELLNTLENMYDDEAMRAYAKGFDFGYKKAKGENGGNV
jgi:hypothetical protein